MLEDLIRQQYEIRFTNHAEAILATDFPGAVSEIETALAALRIPIDDLIGSGGGEAQATQELRNALNDLHWAKKNIPVEVTVDGHANQSLSHEVDHVKTTANGALLLEIEWNNKDPFFDRDLANFKALHGFGAASVGIIITRGSSLQAGINSAIRRRLDEAGVTDVNEMQRLFGEEAFERGMKAMTARQLREVQKRIRSGASVPEALASQLVSDKFGASTTHWSKLVDRIDRGVGNPCPLLLIGIPLSVLTYP